MSKLVAQAYHPVNGSTENVWERFSYPCLLFGPLWFVYKGMWGWALISLVLFAGSLMFSLLLFVITFGGGWFIFPFIANALHAKSLLKKGYLTEKQWLEQESLAKQSSHNSERKQVSSVADELSKLATLKEQGVLTEEEFLMQKSKLIA